MQKTICLLILVVSSCLHLFSQDSLDISYQNSADKLLSTNGRLSIGGYGEVHYNQPLESGIRRNGKLDVHRMVMLFGYRFNRRTQFITELEFEHVKEIAVEQAFMQYKVNNFLNFKAGLILVPMGIINEYHEPTTFNGVERPLIDKLIAPTTWREIGFGISGNIYSASLKYQMYVVNGFNGFDGSPKLNGKNGLRSGRQKGAESYISSPNITGKVEYFGLRGLNIGASWFTGNSQSTLYNGLDIKDQFAFSQADSSIVGMFMLGLDARFSYKGFRLKTQYYIINLSNTAEYNAFTATNGVMNDLGNSMKGYYLELGYNVFRNLLHIKSELIPFIRFESYNTHHSVEEPMISNPKYKNRVITTGVSWKIERGAVVKIDLQLIKPENNDTYIRSVNTGFGVMF